jgi:hypothetical protein
LDVVSTIIKWNGKNIFEIKEVVALSKRSKIRLTKTLFLTLPMLIGTLK